jgi:hypothetical protein
MVLHTPRMPSGTLDAITKPGTMPTRPSVTQRSGATPLVGSRSPPNRTGQQGSTSWGWWTLFASFTPLGPLRSQGGMRVVVVKEEVHVVAVEGVDGPGQRQRGRSCPSSSRWSRWWW